jgi:hypothetical protein
VISAVNRQAIDTSVFAGSAAASVGGGVSVAISGAGGSATNRINTNTLAAIRDTTQELDADDTPTVTGVDIDGDVTVTAEDIASIRSSVMAVSIAAAFGAKGVSFAIGVAVADNTIEGSVRAQIDRATIDTLGAVDVHAFHKPSIES